MNLLIFDLFAAKTIGSNASRFMLVESFSSISKLVSFDMQARFKKISWSLHAFSNFSVSLISPSIIFRFFDFGKKSLPKYIIS